MKLLLIAAVVILAAAPVMGAYYVAGDFNGWDPAGNIMTETAAGSGVWTADLTGLTEGRHEFKITNGTWSENWPSDNSWFVVDASGSITVTYDTNTVADGWVNSTKRIGVSSEPGAWTAVGDWQGWDIANPDTAMTPLGNGVYYFQTNLSVRTQPYEYKAVNTGTWDAIGADARSINAATVLFNVTPGHTQWGFWVNALTGVVKARSLPESPVSYDGLGIPTDFNGLLRATQENPTDFGDNTGDAVGSELDALYIARGIGYGGDGLYIGVTGNLEINGNAYVILLDTAPGVGSNVISALAGPAPLLGLNGTTLDPTFAPKWAISVNNAGGTTYVDLTDLTTNTNYYLGNSQMDSGSPILMGGGAASPAEASFNNTNHVGVTSDPSNMGDPTTAVKGLEMHVPFEDLQISNPDSLTDIKAMVILCAPGGTDEAGNPLGAYMSNQTLPGLGGGYASADIPRGGTTLDFSSFPGDQFAAVSLGSPISSAVTLDGDNIPTDLAGYQAALQDNYTDWGDRTKEHGSELDQLFVGQDGSGLLLGITGNLNTNGDFWLVFLQAGDGGQNTLLTMPGVGPQSDVLANMMGTTFDYGFAPTHVLCINTSGACHVDLVDLRTGVSRYLGSNGVDGGYGILGADNPLDAQVAINNSNILGVTDTDAANADTATTGAEIYLPFGYLGGASCAGEVKVMVWLVDNTGTHVSNQVLPSLPAGTTGPLGVPLYFSDYPGDQFVTIPITGSTFTPVASVQAAKNQPYGTPVHVEALVSESFSNGSFCIQDAAAPMGLLVNWYGTAPAVGSLVSVDGYLSAGPGYGIQSIEACDVTLISPPSTSFIRPCGMSTSAVGGVPTDYSPGIDGATGANNLGTLVKVWGRVTLTNPEEAYFYVDDGSGKQDGTTHDDGTGVQTPNLGVRVFSTAPVSPGDFVTVTGISSLFITYDESNAVVRHPLVLTSSNSDVRVLP